MIKNINTNNFTNKLTQINEILKLADIEDINEESYSSTQNLLLNGGNLDFFKESLKVKANVLEEKIEELRNGIITSVYPWQRDDSNYIEELLVDNYPEVKKFYKVIGDLNDLSTNL